VIVLLSGIVAMNSSLCWQTTSTHVQIKQEAQLALTIHHTLVHADIPYCAVKSCPLVNDYDLLAGFSDFYLPLSYLTPSLRRIPSSYRVHILYGKTRMAGLQSGEGHMMIDSVA